MTIAIRRLRDSDRDQWQRLYYSYLHFYESEPFEEATDILWGRLVADEPQIQGVVVEVDGVIAGFAHFHYQLSTWTHSWHCYLEDLFVDESFRGQGLATALIAHVKAQALAKKCSELYWITRESNETARRVYDKLAKLSDFVRYEVLLED